MGWGIVVGILIGVAISGGVVFGVYRLRAHSREDGLKW
jgi:hypothetical protein